MKSDKKYGEILRFQCCSNHLGHQRTQAYFPCAVIVVGGCGGPNSEPDWTLCIGTDVAAILGVCILVWLEKLEPVRASAMMNRSRCRPSRMCMSVRKELVAVADCRRN